MYTPWGRSDSQKKIVEGVFSVTTPSHGGLMIKKDFAEKNLSKAARRRGLLCGEYLAYEEDVLVNIPLFELPSLWEGFFVNFETEKQPVTVHQSLLKELSYWKADYLLERGIEPEVEGFKVFKARELEKEMRAQKHPNLIVCARGDWQTKIEGVVEVITADGREHLVTKDSYNSLRAPLLLSDCVPYKL